MSSEDWPEVAPSICIGEPPKSQAQCFAARPDYVLIAGHQFRHQETACEIIKISFLKPELLFENCTAQVFYIEQSMTRTIPEEFRWRFRNGNAQYNSGFFVEENGEYISMAQIAKVRPFVA